MRRISWKSVVSLLVVTLVTMGATEPEGCAGGTKDRLPRDPRDLLGGNFLITGHAPDFHAVEDQGAVRLLNKSLAYVRGSNPLPFLWVESRMAPPTGHRSGKAGLNAAGFLEGQDFLHMDAAQLQAQPVAWWAAMSASFSAIVVASDKALLTQAEVDVLNHHRGDIARFMRENRGLLALSESGTGAALTQRDRFEFLPIEVFTTASATPPYSVTTFGHQALGLADEDVNSPAYNRFDGSFGFEVVTISDANGDIIAVAGRIVLAEEYLWANAGPDGTFSGPGPFIPVTLDGSGSTSDATGLPLRYIWMIEDTVVADTTEPIVSIPLLPGVYEIRLILMNNRRDQAEDEVVVTVIQIGTGALTITCPGNMSVPTSPAGVCGAPVNFPPPTVSAPNGVASLTCTPAAGSAFPEGTTSVTCTVVDNAGQSASCSFSIKVNDQEPPTLVPPPPTTSVADAQCRAKLPNAAAAAQATDNCSPRSALVITQSPNAGTQVTGVGPRTIQLQVSDAAGNVATGTATHTVIDQTPPTVSCVRPSKQMLWPPNHKMVPVTVSVTTKDNCGPVQCRITRVTSNEPINGPGDGNTRWDWEIIGTMTVNLRAERAGLLRSRIYTIWFSCMDGSGLGATGSTTVTVPHDQCGR
jgi:hypothetical protein